MKSICLASMLALCGCDQTQNLGQTCRPNDARCGDRCVDPSSDPSNCGACGNLCIDGLVCSAGQCAPNCAQGLTACSEACVSLTSDDRNCGRCGNPCDSTRHCVQGSCTDCTTDPFGNPGTLCPATTDRPAVCTSLAEDPRNCGRCGNICNANQRCFDGVCR